VPSFHPIRFDLNQSSRGAERYYANGQLTLAPLPVSCSARDRGDGPYFLGVQKTDLPGDILDPRADSFNSRYDVIFGHAKSFRPVPQFMLRTDVDTWRPSMLCQNVPLRFRHDGNFFVHNVGAVVRFPHHAATRPWPATSLAYLFIKRSQSGSLRRAIPMALLQSKPYIRCMVSRTYGCGRPLNARLLLSSIRVSRSSPSSLQAGLGHSCRNNHCSDCLGY
jgi:hypothetical protein